MSERDRHRLSFESVAAVYESGRPPYADEAVAWTAERLRLGPESRVLDLAAGTGKLTRQLLPLGVSVVAVEPGDEMRGVLERALGAIAKLLTPLRPGRPPGDWRDTYDRRLFGELDERSFVQERRLTTDTLAQWVASTSPVATADSAEQLRVDDAVRELAGSDVLDLSIATEVIAADRA